MNFIQDRYYRINRILMSSIGQWPYQTRRTSRVCFAVLLFLCSSQIGPQIMAVSQYRNDPAIIIECIPPLLFDCMCGTKLITYIYNSQKMLKLLNRIRKDWQVWADVREIKILHEYAANGRKFTIVYAAAIYSTGIIFMTEPIIPKIIDVLFKNGSEPGVFPIPVYYGRIDMQKNYFYIIMYSYVSVSMIIIIDIAGDVMFIGAVLHGCGIFAAVGYKLKRIGKNVKSTGNVYAVNGRDRDYEDIAWCIDRHNDAIEYAKLIEDIYSWCFFLVVGFNMLMMSVTGLQIVTKTNNLQGTVRLVAFVMAQMVHLYVNTYISHILMDHSTSIRRHVHSGDWYKVSLKAQKSLNLIIMRCNKPCKLTAGKMCVMSVETFAVVVKTSMSYFTLLRTMQ